MYAGGAHQTQQTNLHLRCTVEEWENSGPLLAVRVSSGALTLTALVTYESFNDLGIDAGTELYCTFKSSAVHCF